MLKPPEPAKTDGRTHSQTPSEINAAPTIIIQNEAEKAVV